MLTSKPKTLCAKQIFFQEIEFELEYEAQLSSMTWFLTCF